MDLLQDSFDCALLDADAVDGADQANTVPPPVDLHPLFMGVDNHIGPSHSNSDDISCMVISSSAESGLSISKEINVGLLECPQSSESSALNHLTAVNQGLVGEAMKLVGISMTSDSAINRNEKMYSCVGRRDSLEAGNDIVNIEASTQSQMASCFKDSTVASLEQFSVSSLEQSLVNNSVCFENDNKKSAEKFVRNAQRIQNNNCEQLCGESGSDIGNEAGGGEVSDLKPTAGTGVNQARALESGRLRCGSSKKPKVERNSLHHLQGPSFVKPRRVALQRPHEESSNESVTLRFMQSPEYVPYPGSPWPVEIKNCSTRPAPIINTSSHLSAGTYPTFLQSQTTTDNSSKQLDAMHISATETVVINDGAYSAAGTNQVYNQSALLMNNTLSQLFAMNISSPQATVASGACLQPAMISDSTLQPSSSFFQSAVPTAVSLSISETMSSQSCTSPMGM